MSVILNGVVYRHTLRSEIVADRLHLHRSLSSEFVVCSLSVFVDGVVYRQTLQSGHGRYSSTT